jgi:hypothetical protein
MQRTDRTFCFAFRSNVEVCVVHGGRRYDVPTVRNDYSIVTDRRANSVAFGKGMTQYAWKRTRWNSKPPAIRGGETVLYVLLRCERYAEARKVLQEAAGDR